VEATSSTYSNNLFEGAEGWKGRERKKRREKYRTVKGREGRKGKEMTGGEGIGNRERVLHQLFRPYVRQFYIDFV